MRKVTCRDLKKKKAESLFVGVVVGRQGEWRAREGREEKWVILYERLTLSF